MPVPPPRSRPPRRVARSPTCARPPSTPPQVALARTPDQLEALARAGVVDAGGAGCVLMLESFHRVVTGRWSATDEGLLSAGPPLHRRDEWRHRPPMPVARRRCRAGAPAPHALPGHDPLDRAAEPHGDGPAYEVMYLLDRHRPRGASTRSRAPSTGWVTRCSSSAGPTCGTCTCTSTTRARRSRPASPRVARAHPDHPLRHPGRRPRAAGAARPSSRARPGPASARCCARPAPSSSPRGPGAARLGRPAARGGASRPASAAVVLLPGDRDTLMAAEVAAQAAAGDGHRRARRAGPHHRAGAWPRSRCSTPPARCTPTSSR